MPAKLREGTGIKPETVFSVTGVWPEDCVQPGNYEVGLGRKKESLFSLQSLTYLKILVIINTVNTERACIEGEKKSDAGFQPGNCKAK